MKHHTIETESGLFVGKQRPGTVDVCISAPATTTTDHRNRAEFLDLPHMCLRTLRDWIRALQDIADTLYDATAHELANLPLCVFCGGQPHFSWTPNADKQEKAYFLTCSCGQHIVAPTKAAAIDGWQKLNKREKGKS